MTRTPIPRKSDVYPVDEPREIVPSEESVLTELFEECALRDVLEETDNE